MLRLFLADDMAEMRAVIRWAVQSFTGQYQIVGEAGNGLDALAQIPQLRPDLVIMDVDMPGMDGLTVTQELRRWGDSTPVLFCSGVVDPPPELPSGVVAYLKKPLQMARLEAAIQSVDDKGVR